MRKSIIFIMGLLFGVAAGSPVAAELGDFTTLVTAPLRNSGDRDATRFACNVTNLSDETGIVTVQLINASGGAIHSADLALAARGIVWLTQSTDADTVAYCKIVRQQNRLRGGGSLVLRGVLTIEQKTADGYVAIVATPAASLFATGFGL